MYRPSWQTRSRHELEAAVQCDVAHLQEVTNHHMGYPYNLDFKAQIYPELFGFLLNHLGDPIQGGQYGINVFEKELEVVEVFKQLWGGDSLDDELWGYVSSSGTENNLWAVYTAMTVLIHGHQGREPVIVCSEEGHYSLDKAAAMMRLKLIKVCSNKDGSINIDALKDVLDERQDVPIILGLMSGTTVKEGHDDIEAALKLLKQTGRPRDDFYIHIDGAFSASFLPLVDAPYSINPGFWHDIDSISASGHKYIGCPIPCGILIMKKRHNDKITKIVEYIKSNDTTMAGSRSGLVVYFLWLRLFSLGSDGLMKLALSGIELAGEIAQAFRDAGVDVLHNQKALTLYFPEPSKELIDKYSLACQQGYAHIVAMPNTLDSRSGEFIGAREFARDYLAWWAARH
ncbi:pyridoxal-dependent decarboxylase [Pisolithus thermaeus]|nr:pyridoxal-dependent decarboxylase [Pisolithus sp. B1]KAI6164978.1 pyridoxal-dependent decarboxylase [Pisolithus thermaeus]